MDNRVKWSDKEWALHLKVKVEQVPELRKVVNEKFHAYVAQTIKSDKKGAPVFEDGKWHFCVDRRNDGLDFYKIARPKQIFDAGFNTAKEAAEDANNRIIPNLIMDGLYSSLLGIPEEAVQLLRINTK